MLCCFAHKTNPNTNKSRNYHLAVAVSSEEAYRIGTFCSVSATEKEKVFVLLFTLTRASCSNGLHKLSSISGHRRNEMSQLFFVCVLSWYSYFCYLNVPFRSSKFVFSSTESHKFNSIVCFLRRPISRNKARTYLLDFYIQNI